MITTQRSSGQINTSETADPRRRYHVLLLTLIAALGVVVLAGFSVLTQSAVAKTTTTSSVPAAPDCGPNWAIVPSINPGSGNNDLLGVDKVSANDAWAVGSYSDGSVVQTLIEHWNGTVWNSVSSPSPGTSENYLYGVTAVSASSVWAVGYARHNTVRQTLIERWDGSVWNVVPSPNVGTSDNFLYGVAAVSASDVWAVGRYNNGSANRTLTMHWGGATWTVVGSQNQGTNDNQFNGVTVVGTNDVWAVGYYRNGSAYQTLIEHWTGGPSWSIVSSPNPGPSNDFLNGVAAVSANDVWAVGSQYDGSATRTLIEHYHGSAWTVSPSPNVGTSENVLYGVAVGTVGNATVRAVGYFYNGIANQALLEHWNGSQWSLGSPDNTGASDDLRGVVVVSGSDEWAVGDYQTTTTSPFRTLTERYNPCTPSPTPAPTSTPGSCPIQYTDVAQSSTFYQYIRCLACRTIVGGYNTSPPCTTGIPCFRPGDNVTRGQMAKFISNAANYQDTIPPTQQTFTDVQPNSTFWLYVERAYLHGVINGYTASPPCTTGTPCFLPGNPVTRGQTAKFVSQAANYQDVIPPTQQTFTDVPPSNTFWVYIERVNLHGVVSGYTTSPPCTTGTPCFRPGDLVSRGQTSKFISNAFFPNCQTP